MSTKTNTETKHSKTKQKGRKNIRTGKVISDKMDKTISVLIYNLVKHPRYKKYIKKSSVFKAHDEKNQAKEGDIVRIFETRPLSKTKRWKLIDLVGKGDYKSPDPPSKKKAVEEPASKEI